MKLLIEKNSKADKAITIIFNQIVGTTGVAGFDFDKSKALIADRMARHLGYSHKGLKVGFGGSHIWISNNANERLAVIFK